MSDASHQSLPDETLTVGASLFAATVSPNARAILPLPSVQPNEGAPCALGACYHSSQLQALGLPLSPASLAGIPRFSPIVGAHTAADSTQGGALKSEDARTQGQDSALGDPPEGAKAAVAAKVEKTGLGSSAAMTAAVCSVLLTYWGVVGAEPTGGRATEASASQTRPLPKSPLAVFLAPLLG